MRLLLLALVLGLLAPACGGDEGSGPRPHRDSSGGQDAHEPDAAVGACENGALDDGETDVDCGGHCAACTVGKACLAGADCASGFCGLAYVCVDAACGNGTKDTGETGVDCGGPCPACVGEACGGHEQCASGYCKGGTCDVPTCADGVSNGGETGVDCGGPCAQCADGQGCLADANCLSGFCKAGFCATPSCTDGAKNQNESDVDCGGVCNGCALGRACDGGADCLSGSCASGVCAEVAPSCDDGAKNGGESDTDCGGSCAGCGVGKSCGGAADCLSGLCEGGACVAPASCGDGQKNGGETDADCGGPCVGCPTGKTCGGHADCLSATCVFGVCRDPSCDDDVKNQDETATDCGGSKCGPCPDGEACAKASDCTSGACQQGACISCFDGQKNGSETDADCGGVCKACTNGKHCAKPADCTSGACEGALCCSPNACGQCTTTPQEVCDGQDNDCDGQTDEAAQIGAAPDCPKQQGVCDGSWATCKGLAGWQCDDALYAAHDAAYQATEASCDDRDNDCDGQTDEGVTNACDTCGAVPEELCNGVDDDCDGQTDEVAACQACAARILRTLTYTPTNVSRRNNVARVDDRIWTAYASASTLILAELAEGDVLQKVSRGTVWNPNDGARAPQLRSDGGLLYSAYRTSQLNGASAKYTPAGDQQASTLWSLHSATDVETPRLAVGPTGAAILYRSKEWNGDYDVTTWHVGFYGKAGGWASTKISSWYSEYVGSAAELAVLPDGEILLLHTVGVADLSYRTSKDGYAVEHALPGGQPDEISTALAPDGTLHVVTSGYVNMVGYAAEHRTLKNGIWSAAEAIGEVAEPMVALDDHGEPHVVGSDDEGVGVWTKVGGAWMKAAGFTADEGGFGTPSLAIDAHGRYHVTLARMGYSPPEYGFYYVLLCADLTM